MNDLAQRVQSIAPLPHTAATYDSAGRHVVVGSNGRVLGWVAATCGDWRAVAELWTSAPATLEMLQASRATAGRLDRENELMRAKLANWVEDIRVGPAIREQVAHLLAQIDSLEATDE